jgi:prefoldin subunit 5
MTNDEKINDLTKQLKSIKNQMEYLNDQIGLRYAEISGLRMITEALARTHRTPDDFERALLASHEAFLANAVPSEWSDTQIELVSKTIAELTRH